MAFSSKKILVTGGAGFIGAAIIEQLLKADVGQICVIDNLVRGRAENLSGALQDSRVDLIEEDIRDCDAIKPLVAQADILVHLAALRIRHCISDPDLAFEVMFRAPFDLFQLAAEVGVEQVVTASSSSIYGQANDFPTKESHHPYNDGTIYGAGKLANESMLRFLLDMKGLHFTALRPFNVYGPRMDIHGAYTEVMVRWMERINDGKNPIIYGDGSQSMDFTFVEDVARAFVLAIGSAVPFDCAFNVGTGTSTSLRDLARMVSTAMGSHLAVEYQEAAAIASVERRQADITLARDVLGFEARVGLEEGIRRLVDWWRAEPGVKTSSMAYS